MPRTGPNRPAHKNPEPTPRGVHLLTPPVAKRLVNSCPITRDDLVVDLGAGLGAVTRPIADTGARVLAVERDPDFARRLRRNVREHPNVRVVQDDLRAVRLPRRTFLVVASIPYAVSTAALRRLLTPAETGLRAASLVVEWGFAKRLTATVPRDTELAWWAARFEITLAERIPPHAFRPQPRVQSARLHIRRLPRLNHRSAAALWSLLSAAGRSPDQPVRALVTAVADRRAGRQIATAGIDPAARAGSVRPGQWAELASTLAADPGLRWPPPPRHIRHDPASR